MIPAVLLALAMPTSIPFWVQPGRSDEERWKWCRNTAAALYAPRIIASVHVGTDKPYSVTVGEGWFALEPEKKRDVGILMACLKAGVSGQNRMADSFSYDFLDPNTHEPVAHWGPGGLTEVPRTSASGRTP